MSEKFTYNQVNQQESSAYMNRSGADPTVLIKRSERSGGGVTVGRLDKSTRNVHFSEDGVDKYHPAVPLAELSDQRQAELAEELAGAALRSSEVPAVSESAPVERAEAVDSKPDTAAIEAALDELKESMAESDRIPTWQYATALHDHELNNAIGKLSQEGRSQAIRYRELFQKLKAARGDK